MQQAMDQPTRAIATADNRATEPVAGIEKPPGLWALVREDWTYNGKDWTRPGFRALFVHRFGNWRMGIRPRVLRMPFSWLYRVMFRYVRNHYGIELYYTVKVGRRVVIGHQGAIVIHEHAEIGDECVLRQGVTIGAAAQYRIDLAPRLGKGIDVGAGAMILGKVTIGDGARIGPNCVIMMNIPAGATVVMPPPRVIPAASSAFGGAASP